MSEFKFACPVCGQHITADSSSSGGQIECPTCFQKIVVPQAPASQETKFILSASQVSKPRPGSAESASQAAARQPAPSRRSGPVAVVLLILVCTAGGAIYLFRDKIFGPPRAQRPPASHEAAKKKGGQAPKSAPIIPTNMVWSLDLKNAAFPEATAAGSIHGSAFACERATLEAGRLSLRQGMTWPPDLGLTISLPNRPGEELAGRTIEIAPDQPPPVPRVTLRWKDDQQEPAKHEVNRGYALKLVFGQPADGRQPGQIYLCVPDEARSIVAGTFDAEIRKPKPGSPRPPRPKGRPRPTG